MFFICILTIVYNKEFILYYIYYYNSKLRFLDACNYHEYYVEYSSEFCYSV